MEKVEEKRHSELLSKQMKDLQNTLAKEKVLQSSHYEEKYNAMLALVQSQNDEVVGLLRNEVQKRDQELKLHVQQIDLMTQEEGEIRQIY